MCYVVKSSEGNLELSALFAQNPVDNFFKNFLALNCISLDMNENEGQIGILTVSELNYILLLEKPPIEIYKPNFHSLSFFLFPFISLSLQLSWKLLYRID